jgi:hypothetical protein
MHLTTQEQDEDERPALWEGSFAKGVLKVKISIENKNRCQSVNGARPGG